MQNEKVNKYLFILCNKNKCLYDVTILNIKTNLENIFLILEHEISNIDIVRENVIFLLDILKITTDNYNEYIIICEQLLNIDLTEKDINIYKSYIIKILENKNKINKLLFL